MGGVDPPEFQAKVQAKRIARMEAFDRMPPDIRECVRQYGFNVVNTCISLGVKKAPQIRHLVETILDEFSPTRGSFSRQGIFTRVEYEAEQESEVK